MNDRIVVQLVEWAPRITNGTAERTVLLLLAEPQGHGDVGQFTCTGAEEVFTALGSAHPQTDVVTAAGQLLLDAVNTGNTAIRDLVSGALQRPDRRPIYLNLTHAKDSHALPWEALCTENGVFLALQSRWPIGRMLAGTSNAVLERTLEPPLRLAAVLSCRGITARSEWEALRTAVERSDAPVRLLLLLAEPDLHDEIAAIPNLGWLELGMIPATFPELQHSVSDFDPHLLHFFCHGRATGGAHLEIGIAADRLNPGKAAHHRLEARSIRDLMAAKEAPWAIVLNACNTAAGDGETEGTRSLAADLVVEHGVPAVIGMREPVLGTDAARFTEAFYTALLSDMGKWVAGEASGATIDWASYTVDARAALCHDREVTFDVAAARHHEWTLPVVVVRPGTFTLDVVDVGPAGAAAREQASRTAEATAAVLAAIAKLAPEETVAAFEEAMRTERRRAGRRV